MRRVSLLFTTVALVGLLALPASARPTVRGETYQVGCSWGTSYVQPTPYAGVVAWDTTLTTVSGPSLRLLFTEGIWFSPDEATPVAESPVLEALNKTFDLSLCHITGPVEGGEQLSVWGYFVRMPNAS